MDIKLLKRTQKTPQHIRNEGYIPVAVYGRGIRHGDLMVSKDVILPYLRSVGEQYSSTLVSVIIDNNVYKSIIKSIDQHYKTLDVIHIDFYIPSENYEFISNVPVVVVNENLCVDLKSGKAALIVPMKSIQVLNTLTNLTESIIVDISKLHKGRMLDMSNGNIKFDGSKFIDVNSNEIIHLSPKFINSFKLHGENLKEVRVPAYNVIHSYEFPQIKFVNKKRFPIVSIK